MKPKVLYYVPDEADRSMLAFTHHISSHFRAAWPININQAYVDVRSKALCCRSVSHGVTCAGRRTDEKDDF